MSGNEQVLVEIETFLLALVSYADRVASEPKVSFEEHRVSLMGPLSGAGSRPMARAARVGSR
jgi:hypothetical protein